MCGRSYPDNVSFEESLKALNDLSIALGNEGRLCALIGEEKAEVYLDKLTDLFCDIEAVQDKFTDDEKATWQEMSEQ